MNIACRISELSQVIPDKKSVILAKDESFYTFKEFEEKSNQYANKFIKLGIQKGTRTLLFVKPCLDFSVITFALFKVGAIPVLIDPGMGIENLLTSIKQVKPEALMSVGMVHWLRRFKKNYFETVKIKVSLQRVGGSTHYLYNRIDEEPKEFKIHHIDPSDHAAILFTSGGTGIPKGVLYTHGILNAQTDALKKMFDLQKDQTDLPGFPLFALFTLALGMTSVIPEMDPTKPAQCDPKKIVKNLIDHKVTLAAGTPAIWERVGKYCVENEIKLPDLKQIVMFGAPVRAEIHQYFKNVLISGDTYTPYGATECLPVSLISGSEILRDHLPKMIKGFGTCIGKAVPGVQIKIMAVSDKAEVKFTELPLGEVGEIIVQGPQVTPSYFEMPDETLKAKINQDGFLWHRMGDLGWMDESGHLWFLGRKGHRVEALEKTFYPIQVEAIFNQHHTIRRTALIKLIVNDKVVPALAIETHNKDKKMTDSFLRELTVLKNSEYFTSEINHFFLYPGFPVDVRHNIKIDRTKLSHWAQKQIDQK